MLPWEMKMTCLQSDSCHNVEKKLKDTFPKLESASGYTLARSITTRNLQRIEPPYSAYLKLRDYWSGHYSFTAES